jgi:NAD(P)-dependent dehydrogenase (short-subunit alcohol dehydrogenase family)
MLERGAPEAAAEGGSRMNIEERAGLRGKRAIVIGGAFGLGRAVTLALASSGVELAICDDDAEALPDTVAAAQGYAVPVFGSCIDALDIPSLEGFYREAGERLGGLDILVNVVGGANMGPFDQTDANDWASEIHRNFGYVIHSTKAALPLLRRSGRGGSIINFTTIEAHRGAAQFAVYAGAKAATTNFSRAMAVELGRERIRVNTIASDMTPTRGNLRSTHASLLASGASLPDKVRALASAIAVPLGAPPSVDEVANGVLFLASDLSSSVTGATLHADGGTFAASGFNWWPHDNAHAPRPLPNSLRRLFADEIGG